MKRVVITGIGMVTPLGNTFEDSWDSLMAGRNGISLLAGRNIPQTIKLAGILKEFRVGKYLKEKEVKRIDPFVQYAVSAASMALQDAFTLDHPGRYYDRNKTAVLAGSSRGGIMTISQSLNKLHRMRFTASKQLKSSRLLSPYLMPSTTTSMAASFISQLFGFKGYCLGISNACSSGTNALGEAYRLLKHGYSDVAIAGGTEAPICELCIEGYNATGALTRSGSINASKPFDVKRDGFVLSEGACILVLEEYDRAIKRRAKIYAEIVGYGNTTDGFDQVRPDPQGEAAAMRLAMKDAGLEVGDIELINAHGSSTPLGDRKEAEAVRIVFGKRAGEIPVTANKSMTGHMLAASGAFEVAATAMTIREGFIPPTINVRMIDPHCGINMVTEALRNEVRNAISNSFGFGGVNAVIALKKCHTI